MKTPKKKKKKRDAEILKTSNLPNKIISSPPQSRKTIPLSVGTRILLTSNLFHV